MKLWPDWRTATTPSSSGPGVTLLHESADLKVVLVALEPGQALPEHPGPAASFHFLDGDGVMIIDGERCAVAAGATTIAPPGSVRGVQATGNLVFIGNLGDPGSEQGPH